jgi:hypothetical protein
MTCQLKESDFCTKESTISGSDIEYGCLTELSKQPVEIRNHYKCDSWNLKIYDLCKVCELNCPENKNEDLEAINEHKRKLKMLMTKVNPAMMGMPVNPMQAEQISKKFAEINSMDPEGSSFTDDAMEAANFASDILSAVMSGRIIDLAYFREASNSVIKNVKEKTGDHNIRNPDFKASIKQNPYINQIEAIKKNMKIE